MKTTPKNWPTAVIRNLVSHLPPEARRRIEVGLPQTLPATMCRGCGKTAFRVADPKTVECLRCNLGTHAELGWCFCPGYVNLRAPRTRLRILVRPHEATRRSSGLVVVTGWDSQVDAGLCGILAPRDLPRAQPIIDVIGSRRRDHVWTQRLGLQVLSGCDWVNLRWRWPSGECVYDPAGPGDFAIRTETPTSAAYTTSTDRLSSTRVTEDTTKTG